MHGGIVQPGYPASRRQRIAIVEDESDIAGLLAHCLACEGFHVSTAGDGNSGLEMIRRYRPDLVLLDLMLPQLNGWDLFRAMKASRDLERIPVVVLSANGDVANRIALLEEGVDDYIVKPCSVREIIARSRAVLRRAGGPHVGREAHDP
jgi:two-component system phosphate regulon response regulator PhoB